MARAGAGASLQSETRHLPFPLVLGLFGRADDEPGRAPDRHRAVGHATKGPTGVSSTGGRFALEDNGETPDTQDALLEYPGMTAVWSHREASMGQRAGNTGLEFFGTKGAWRLAAAGSKFSQT